MALFTLTYAPKNSFQVFGQDKAIQELRDFIVHHQQKQIKAALLEGPIGVGKTSSVYALAKELGYDILEINSSDIRNEDNMGSFLSSSLGQQSLFFRPKIILIDEIDNISGVRDRGCLSAILKAIETAKFPVILTANDASDSKFKQLRKATQHIEFHKLQYRTIAHSLQWVCEQEGITAEEKAVNSLARLADGDMRSALIDLQVCVQDKNFTFAAISQLADRKRTDSMMNVLSLIFKSSSAANVLSTLDTVDVDTEEVIFWLDENLPKEYRSAPSLAKAYEALSRADVFQGRIARRQHWRFLVYINDLLTAGISAAKEEKNTQFVPYRPTMRILNMWQAKMRNAKKKEIAAKIALILHISEKRAVQEIPYLQFAFKKNHSAMIQEFGLSDEEVEWLER